MQRTTLGLLQDHFSAQSHYQLDRNTCSQIQKNLSHGRYALIKNLHLASDLLGMSVLTAIIVNAVVNVTFTYLSLYALLLFAAGHYLLKDPARICHLTKKLIRDIKSQAFVQEQSKKAEKPRSGIHTVHDYADEPDATIRIEVSDPLAPEPDGSHEQRFTVIERTHNRLWLVQKLILGNLGAPAISPSNNRNWGPGYRLGGARH